MTGDELRRRRAKNLLLPDGREVRTDRDAGHWIEARGFCPLGRTDDLSVPSISDADAGGGSWEVSDSAWGWKETLPEARACLYTKFFRGGGTFIAWDYLPYFYVLYATGRSTADDYAAGLLSRTERRLLEMVEEAGPIDSRELWRRFKKEFPGPRSRLLTALTQSQRTFRLTVCGGSLEGWSVHRWDLLGRQVPGSLLDGLPLPDEAREKLLLKYVENAVACPLAEPARAFHWERPVARGVIDRLTGRGHLRIAADVAGIRGDVLLLP
ncbi:MAG TPA: hypothetical protein VGL40_06255 [Bacillota bacterium]|jgi:hypothetical protein